MGETVVVRAQVNKAWGTSMEDAEANDDDDDDTPHQAPSGWRGAGGGSVVQPPCQWAWVA